MPHRIAFLTGTTPPAPAETEGDVRMVDVQVAYDVCVEVQRCRRGARRRVASRHGVCPSTVTECMKRVDRAMGAALFEAGSGGYASSLSAAGKEFIRSGDIFLKSYQILRKQVQRAGDEF